jgi:hypothetical protein
MKEEGWLMKYIREKASKEQDACFTIPRLLFGSSRELSADTIVEDYPEGLEVNPFCLDTIRWRFHARPDHHLNGHAKVIIDASQLGSFIPLAMKIRNPHRPLYQICHSPFYGDAKNSEFRILHYLGSWEAYSFRDDSRKGRERSREVSFSRHEHELHRSSNGFVSLMYITFEFGCIDIYRRGSFGRVLLMSKVEV